MTDAAPTAGRPPTSGSRPAWEAAAVAVALAVLVVVLLAFALGCPLGHDEEMFVAASVFSTDLLLYADFLYLQTPLLPLVQGLVLGAASGADALLVVRLTNWGYGAGAMLLLFTLARHLTGSARAAAGFAALFVLSEIMQRGFGTARNDIMALCFALLGVWLLFVALRRDRGSLHHCLFAGLCLACAVGAKISAAYAPAACVIYLLLVPSSRLPASRWRRFLAPLVVGGLVGATPIVVLWAMAPEPFLYSNFGYHLTTPAQYYTWLGAAERLSLRAVLSYVLHLPINDTTLAASGLCVLVAAAIALVRAETGAFLAGLRDNHGLLMALLAAMALLVGALPRPPWPQYYQPVVPFLVLTAAAVQPYIRRRAGRWRYLLALAIAAVMAWRAVPDPARLLVQLSRPPAWATNHVAADARAIAAVMPENFSGQVWTLSPIRAMAAGLTVSPRFATGPFFFRTAAFMDPERAARLGGVAPALLDRFYAQQESIAIVAGYEAEVEGPLVDWAARHGFVTIRVPNTPAYVMLPP